MSILFELIIAAIVVLVIGTIVLRLLIPRLSPKPTNLGIANGRLSPCPNTPNCVSSQVQEDGHAIAPIPYSTTTTDAHAKMLNILREMPRASIVTNEETYIHAETRSSIMGYIDDNEFFFDDAAKLIHVRAAARLGREDFKANRNRVEAIRKGFNTN